MRVTEESDILVSQQCMSISSSIHAVCVWVCMC